ncbi:hypothetical protein [Enterovibrio norvegicus]|uniref:hypothetical protein n=1 Tax=Enterovibrio norvegicus TaxID=188144 RepID=UPI0013CFB281|nr:hypothetical protein [Enterovibrio norvegicus]
MEFHKWYASFVQENEADVKKLFASKTAVHFLMAWSIFETYYFSGFARVRDIESVCKGIVNGSNFKSSNIESDFKYFHSRYQDQTYNNNLRHGKSFPLFESIVNKAESDISIEEKVTLLVCVVYRFRNNIFHGNKGVQSWLNYDKQILRCINIMQSLLPEHK